ncbi:MAG TPA: GNAT family N-acetyltransferase [Methylomicrobium sp.]|nr:GNAT family N-acetyltransferase [Methylomicrobium sp.]
MIETHRLCLRGFREEDWQAVHTYSTDPEVLRYVPGDFPSEEETRHIIRCWTNGQTDDPPHYDFAVTVHLDDFVIGWCCLQISSGDPRVGELMYVFNRNFWKQGYATEAAQAIVDYGFSKLQLHRIYATCRPENIGSWHVLEKVGMQREGLLRENIWIRGSWRNSYLYAMVDSEWKAQKNSS